MKKLLAGLVLIPLSLVGCSGQKPEKERFINATKDIACMVFKSNDLFDPALKGKTDDIFKQYGFDPANADQKQALSTKYKDDADVKAAVEQAIKDCGGDLTKKFGAGSTTAPTTPATDSTKTDTKPATTKTK